MDQYVSIAQPGVITALLTTNDHTDTAESSQKQDVWNFVMMRLVTIVSTTPKFTFVISRSFTHPVRAFTSINWKSSKRGPIILCRCLLKLSYSKLRHPYVYPQLEKLFRPIESLYICDLSSVTLEREKTTGCCHDSNPTQTDSTMTLRLQSLQKSRAAPRPLFTISRIAEAYTEKALPRRNDRDRSLHSSQDWSKSC